MTNGIRGNAISNSIFLYIYLAHCLSVYILYNISCSLSSLSHFIGGEHFVLLVGYSSDGDTLAVQDPMYDVDVYSYQFDIMGYRLYDIEIIRETL